ncbi:MAG: hypothetical protein K2X28_03945 [Alphaproteobacteria bacterium]|nr:hypothetical protein [Alphaproteobacteria bacterium]
MFKTPEFWVLIAFVLFLLAFGKKIWAFLTQSLDEHRNKISRQLEEAERLHDEALSLLKAYKQKHEEVLKQTAEIIAFAEEEALTLKKEKEREFDHFMKQREKALLQRMENEKEETKAAFRQQILEEAIAHVESFLEAQKGEKKKLTEDALKEITDISLFPKDFLK